MAEVKQERVNNKLRRSLWIAAMIGIGTGILMALVQAYAKPDEFWKSINE